MLSFKYYRQEKRREGIGEIFLKGIDEVQPLSIKDDIICVIF